MLQLMILNTDITSVTTCVHKIWRDFQAELNSYFCVTVALFTKLTEKLLKVLTKDF